MQQPTLTGQVHRTITVPGHKINKNGNNKSNSKRISR